MIEQEPRGTAGGVKACMEHLGGDDFLVIGGDCICDLDLSEAIRFHRARNAQATLVLYHHRTPLEYGLVITDGEGRVCLLYTSIGRRYSIRMESGMWFLPTA